MATLGLCWVPPVSAHEETALEALTVIDDVQPRIDGISFRVAHLTQPVLVAENRTDRSLTIFGPTGEPFLRLRNERVDTNANSPLTYSTRSPSGLHGITPPGIDPDAPPLWREVGRGTSWSWFDPRIRVASSGTARWSVIAGWGQEKISIEGSFETLDAHGHFDTEVVTTPDIEGLEIQLTDGLVPALFVRNETGQELAVEGRAGEPFLRIGPEGVFGNMESPDLYMGGMQTVRAVPRYADPDDPPRWRRLSTVPTWAWLEFRARLPESANLRSTLGDTRHPILSWRTPMALGGSEIAFAGRVQWIPPLSASPERARRENRWWPLLVFGVPAVAVLVLARLRK